MCSAIYSPKGEDIYLDICNGAFRPLKSRIHLCQKRLNTTERTCHVLKCEGSWGIAPGVALLVSHPGFVKVLHEAIFMRATGIKLI